MHSNVVGERVGGRACLGEPDWDAGLEDLLSRTPPEDPRRAGHCGGGRRAGLAARGGQAAGHARLPDDALPLLVAAAARLGTWASSVELAATTALTERARG